MEMTWTCKRTGETQTVVAVEDEDGDFDARPVGNTDPFANFTVFASELANGTVILVPA
jgi:hypothetical protein